MTASEAFVQRFLATMPAEYHAKHQGDAVRRHAAVAFSRQGQSAAVHLLDATTLCIATDHQPGLLAKIGAALVLSELDVVHAESHTRKGPGGSEEALVLLEVRREDSSGQTLPLSDEEARDLELRLRQLLDGSLDEQQARPSLIPAAARRAETVVRFIEDDQGQLSVLEVETDDRSGLLLSMARALFALKVQIENFRISTTDNLVHDRFRIAEFDGSPIADDRRLEIQVAILSSIDGRLPT